MSLENIVHVFEQMCSIPMEEYIKIEIYMDET